MPSIIDTDPWPAANIGKWVRRQRWHWAEAAALLLGREPQAGMNDGGDYRSTEIATSYRNSADEDAYWELTTLLQMAVDEGELVENERPATMLRWADRMEISYPEGLKAAPRFAPPAAKTEREAQDSVTSPSIDKPQDVIDALTREISALKAREAELQEEAKPNSGATKRLHSFKQAFLGMALDKFHYDPGVSKSPATANIVAALARCGIALTDDTVRSLLKEAASTVDWKSPRDT